jgi:hypothetical protein
MFASRAGGTSFVGAHDYRQTVTHVPGQNGYLCLRTPGPSNSYEAPGCQEAKYSPERKRLRFFVLAMPASESVG